MARIEDDDPPVVSVERLRRSLHYRPDGSAMPKSITLRDALTEAERAAGAELVAETRPRMRGECIDGPRPCPWVSCRYHLYLDVTIAGSIRLNFPDREVDDLAATCALDVADHREHTLEEVGDLMNLTRERIRQTEERALWKVRQDAALAAAGRR